MWLNEFEDRGIVVLDVVVGDEVVRRAPCGTVIVRCMISRGLSCRVLESHSIRDIFEYLICMENVVAVSNPSVLSSHFAFGSTTLTFGICLSRTQARNPNPHSSFRN
jgi:hypothetical protein